MSTNWQLFYKRICIRGRTIRQINLRRFWMWSCKMRRESCRTTRLFGHLTSNRAKRSLKDLVVTSNITVRSHQKSYDSKIFQGSYDTILYRMSEATIFVWFRLNHKILRLTFFTWESILYYLLILSIFHTKQLFGHLCNMIVVRVEE